MTHDLTRQIADQQVSLADRLECARRARTDFPSPGSIRTQADMFLCAATQHLAAAAAVLAPEAARLEGGPAQVHVLVRRIKDLERAMVRAKARVYGQAQSVRRPWDEVWNEVRDAWVEVAASEAALVAMLEEHLGAGSVGEIRERFDHAAAGAHTRPHPYLPHLGVMGRAVRRFCATADRLWDELEGRVTTTAPRAAS